MVVFFSRNQLIGQAHYAAAPSASVHATKFMQGHCLNIVWGNDKVVRRVFCVERTQRARVWPSSRVWLYHFIFPHGPPPREVAVLCAEVQIAKTHCRCRALLQRTLNLAVSTGGQGATRVHPTSETAQISPLTPRVKLLNNRHSPSGPSYLSWTPSTRLPQGGVSQRTSHPWGSAWARHR